MVDESYKVPGFYETQLDLYLKRERKENGLVGFHVSGVPGSDLEGIAHDVLEMERAFHEGKFVDVTNEPL